MPLVSFHELMASAETRQYAVGYFESWNLESLLAVADAAEAARSPVILGFSGINLPDPQRLVREPLAAYAALGLEVCRRLSVPACLLFNESPYYDAVIESIGLGFTMVMYSNDDLTYEEEVSQIQSVVEAAHAAGVAVEGEAAALPGIGGELTQAPDDFHLTDPQAAREFIEATGVDAFAVNIGQAHLHGRHELRLRLDCLAELRKTISVPMVLHGATSVHRDDFPAVIALGIRKINVGSVLKQTYFEAVRRAVMQTGQDYNPYDVLGSGSPQDVLTAGRIAMQRTVEELMIVFGSAGKA